MKLKRVLLVVVVVLLVAGGGLGWKFREKIFGPSEIRIGANMELTGNMSDYGVAGRDGLKLAVEEANAAGGIKGKRIVVIDADAKSKATDAGAAFEKLVTKDKCLAVVGPCATSTTLGAVPVAERLKVPMISPSASNPAVTVNSSGRTYKYVFRACFIDPQQGNVMAELATGDLNAKSAALIIDETLDYSKGLAEIFRRRFERNDGKIVAEQRIRTGDKDIAAQLAAIKAANPQVVFAALNYEEVILVLKQARAMGIVCPFLGSDTWEDPSIFNEVGPVGTKDIYYPTVYYDKDPATKAFATKYRSKFGKNPTSDSVAAYDCGKVVVDAIKRANSYEPEKITAAIEATRNLSGVMGSISFDNSHNPIGKPVVVMTYRDHSAVMYTKVAAR